MAGSGKTTLMQRFNNYFHLENVPNYIVNLDPAVSEVPYDPNIDIRDTVRWCPCASLPFRMTTVIISNLFAVQVNYKNVMKQYSLGPNGGILTAMNLFATRFDQVC